jgi:hypothetical protein
MEEIMQKIHVSITLDPEVLVILKEEKGINNVSKLIEELLKDFIDTPTLTEEQKKKKEFIALLNDLKDNYNYNFEGFYLKKGDEEDEQRNNRCRR